MTTWVLQAVNKLMKRDVQTGPLTTQELNYAKLLWDLHVQYKHYSDIINKVKQRKGNNGKDQLLLFIIINLLFSTTE